jgi:hypothetical protein
MGVARVRFLWIGLVIAMSIAVVVVKAVPSAPTT